MSYDQRLSSLQPQLPRLPHQILPEAAVRLSTDQLEADGLINLARARQDVVGPKLHAPVAHRARMSDALLHRTAADTAAACVRLNVEKPQLGELVGLLDQKN